MATESIYHNALPIRPTSEVRGAYSIQVDDPEDVRDVITPGEIHLTAWSDSGPGGEFAFAIRLTDARVLAERILAACAAGTS